FIIRRDPTFNDSKTLTQLTKNKIEFLKTGEGKDKHLDHLNTMLENVPDKMRVVVNNFFNNDISQRWTGQALSFLSQNN
ncbi:MAG: hypothetical protein KAG53_09510, partial [Endozoicomonadaceae bacterium]|nr:hypothetical protein [Endozoicomonadaceae bacterium]